MPTTDQDARALTYLAKRLREETHGANRWDEAGIHAIVSKFVGRNLAVTIEQVTRHAADVEAKTPGAIMRPFTPEAPKADRRWEPPKRHEECPRHPGQYRLSCGGCAADRRAIRDEAEAQAAAQTATTKEEALATMRRDVELAKGWTERGGRQ